VSARRLVPFLFAALLAASWAGSAQAAVPFGVRAGLTESTFNGSLSDVVDQYRPGIDLGIWTRLPIGGTVDLQPELHFIVKGGQGDFGVSGVDSHIEYSLMYFEVPVLARFALPPLGSLETYAVAGPALAWRVESRAIYETSSAVPLRAGRVQGAVFYPAYASEPDFASWDVGVVGGAGLSLVHGRARFVLDARYEYDFVDLLDVPGLDATNAVFALTLGMEMH